MEYSAEEKDSDSEIIDDILGPEDLFNDEANEDEDFGQSDHEETKESSGKIEGDSEEKVKKKIRQPKVVRNPRVTLNFDSLSGKNGLSALKKLFENFKFKGDGHEKEDLTKIMRILQQWMCYQLCPSYDFESCMLQLETLGKKKVVQTLIQKYRLGMDEWGEGKPHDDLFDSDIEINENPSRNEFDLLLNEEISNTRNEGELNQVEVIQDQRESPRAVEEEIVLTPELLEKIAQNRKLAEERKLKRLRERCQQEELNQQQENTDHPEIHPEIHPETHPE